MNKRQALTSPTRRERSYEPSRRNPPLHECMNDCGALASLFYDDGYCLSCRKQEA